jgi:signal transduction histidine kinase
MKLASKFTLTLVLGIVLVHAGSAIVRAHREEALFHQDITRDSKVLGRALGHAVKREWQTRGERAALDLIDDATDWESGNRIRWVWLDGRVEARHHPAVEAAAREASGERAVSVTQDVNGDSAVYTYVSVETPDGRRGSLEIQDPLIDEHRYLRQSWVNSAIATLVLVVLCALLSWALGHVLIGKRVRRLVAQARDIGRGELETRVQLPGRDELSELAREMDSMCEGLRDAVARIRVESESRSRAEEQLRHADRLTSAGTLASGMAHELGTPINVIEGYAQLIIEDAESGARTRESAGLVVQQCRRMTQIIQQLLKFTRRGGSSKATADARDVLAETLRLVNPMVRRLGVETDLAAASEPILVGIGSNQLQQVLTNLLINGLQAMQTGGRLSVALARRRAAHPRGGQPPPSSDYVSIRVEDTGVGMDDETLQRVFEPFFTTKDVGEGSGLGLSVAYGIIEDHGGWIDVQSKPGSGSSFTVYLPPGHGA